MSGLLWRFFILLALSASEFAFGSEESEEELPVTVTVEVPDEPNFDPDSPPPGESTSSVKESRRSVKLRGRQKSFIRNPNYVSANKYFDKIFQNEHIKDMYGELPPPHPGFEGEPITDEPIEVPES
ncbi:uncharacterized protein LOC108091371 [Drosophila ficusphila]|uniref:uncharacterized protein LOC108091371 n=1 Tax=Drosophila ficusphila TaxID=30025 RepID=UPI0007E771C5|nr:uncharacterized protein LOC108091371 [Drosophila ficusphila]